MTHADVIVVGAGPVGALAALRLARDGRRVLMIEARAAAQTVRDARALALSWASRALLAEVGAFPDTVPVSVIDTVHVSQQGRMGRTRISRDDLALPHLGVVVDYPALTCALAAVLEDAGVTVRWQSRVCKINTLARYATVTLDNGELLSARLLVLADGGSLAETLPGIRRHVHDYAQSALLAQIEFEEAPAGVAFERFADAGPLALLPHAGGYMLVWTRTRADALRLQSAAPEVLAAELQQAFGERLGRIVGVGERALFALALRQLNRVTANRVVMIGNAAQTMHPVAAQGLNLGLRDAAQLADSLAGIADPGDAAGLAVYARARKRDSHAVVGFTHGLIRLFDGASTLTGALRGAGMMTLDAIPPLRRRFAGHLVFGV
ncbi:FAD-dependent oxidoreductase [Craterilacuibacter sp. RT1T]|uniref:FAD-dependent oxidoreductase n=1 Tax=Craterilacuibacter sp. RT1T TaxID=2942211 RepID=UPI0020C002C3|nr:FAD-dependent oxidoreductase [Craterilacuibacter sp. RT1T]MCL6264700.1 FAD-dependent oxidoreductase [Craterilacuibacter sp. RT1T]